MAIKDLRRLMGVSRAALAKSMRCSSVAIVQWEKRRWNWELGSERAWLIYVGWVLPDPVNGLLKAQLGLPPNGELPREVAQKLAREAKNMVKVAGYHRRKRKPKGLKETSKTPRGAKAGLQSLGFDSGDSGTTTSERPSRRDERRRVKGS